MLGAAHRRRRIHRHHLADHQPVEQVAQRRQVALGGGRAAGRRQLLNVAGDVEAGDLAELADTALLAPGEEGRHVLQVGAPGVRIPDVGGEELQEAPAGAIAHRLDEGRRLEGGGTDDEAGGHGRAVPARYCPDTNRS
jgi:hypothetical protein